MATENPELTRTALAGADLSAKQYYFMKNTAAENTVDVNDTAGGKSVGVLIEPAASGLPVTVQHGGVCKVVASAAISINDDIMSTNAGKAATSTSGKQILGIALQAAGADGDIIEMLWQTRGLTP